jgi:hypothetical protein
MNGWSEGYEAALIDPDELFEDLAGEVRRELEAAMAPVRRSIDSLQKSIRAQADMTKSLSADVAAMGGFAKGGYHGAGCESPLFKSQHNMVSGSLFKSATGENLTRAEVVQLLQDGVERGLVDPFVSARFAVEGTVPEHVLHRLTLPATGLV